MSATDSPTFPIRPVNRPALPRIAYRLGAYPDIVDAILRRINAATELARWTHRNADDPGIAIVESAAIVADILTFYQEHYANEAFLRTALGTTLAGDHGFGRAWSPQLEVIWTRPFGGPAWAA